MPTALFQPLRQQAAVENVDYCVARGLDPARCSKSSPKASWIDAHENFDPVRADRRRQKLS